MYDPIPDFGENYAESRGKFFEAMKGKGEIHSAKHPDKGPDGDDLFMDVGVIGPDDAEGALVLVSGTHGPELICGAGSITAFLNSGIYKNFNDLKLILVHAHNPYGCAWMRRTDQNNVDLNRNYYDFSVPFTPHPGYDNLRPIIVPEEWDAEKTAKGLATYEAEHGKVAMLGAMVTGQSHDANGLFYRGSEPSWSRIEMTRFLQELTAKQKTVSVVDAHTALGPYGDVYMAHGYHPDEPQFKAFREAYGGNVRSVNDPDDIDEDMPGTPAGPFVMGVGDILPDKLTYAIVIEIGTLPSNVVFPALMRDNWLHIHGTPGDEEWNTHKTHMREVFYPREDEWKDKVWKHMIWSINSSAQLARGEVG